MTGVAEWLVPLATGVLSAGGQAYADRTNVRLSREQMRFQERMASTQAQRAVKDYTAAGLNPALAYDRPASAPSGAAATVGNPVEKGVSSAMTAAQLRANLELTKAQTDKAWSDAASAEADAAVKSGVTQAGEPTYRDEVMARRRGVIRDIGFTGTMQPEELRRIQLDNILRGADVNRRQLMSSLFGSARDAEAFIRQGFSKGPEALQAARAWGNVGLAATARQADQVQKWIEASRARGEANRARLAGRKTRGGW